MDAYSLTITVPDVPPFERPDGWFLSFIGAVIVPMTGCPNVKRFWFTRYGGVGVGKEAKFRFETDDIAATTVFMRSIVEARGLSMPSVEKYDVADDIGRGENSRFLGTNASHRDHRRRGELAFDFLHASARLLFDCLVGPSAEGHFALEEEKKSGFNFESPLEQFHHLFCNMTCVPTFVACGKPPGSEDIFPITGEEFKSFSHQGWRLGDLRKGNY